MTNIKIYRDKNKNIVKAEFDGHALFSNENDIVCSALSAVSYLTANGIEKDVYKRQILSSQYSV